MPHRLGTWSAPCCAFRIWRRRLTLGAATLMTVALCAPQQTSANIDKPAQPGGPDVTVVIPPGPLRLQCWQYSVKIIDERGLSDLRESSIGVSRWLRFRRDGGEVVLTAEGDMSCVITQERIKP